MNIVAIDTSGPTASCAVMRDGEIIHSVFLNQGLTHSETIMPALDEAMTSAQIDCSQVDAFAAVAGPGSFTGVRIGVCAVKGLAHAHNTPCASVDALEALAMNVIGFDGIACPILDARRGQVYCAAFDVRGELPVRVLPDQALELNAYLAQLPQDRRLIFVGDGLRVHADAILRALGDRAVIAAANLRNLRAEAACILANAHRDQWMEARKLVPIYLRAPQAERERDRRLREGK
ncbi:MAG: tRNA (adenosine(37)-N6)-threonylcarbamoyltransferase complex dimerization subunit type 1 TsaB [Clostridia bacterium]|nr:tRNA (adenosine(37)-N6)-threonylcarbamoyltransferase complex dimerization subunit type 1 TsaB [Clostridia bacterium]